MRRMRMTRHRTLALVSLLSLAAPAAASAQDATYLGAGRVDVSTRQPATIAVASQRLRTIAIETLGGDVFVTSIRVHLAGGEVRTIPVNELVRTGARSRHVSLGATQNPVERIEVLYRSDAGRRIVTFRAFGQLQTQQNPPPNPNQ